ncbi:hypothetical protein [Legionella sp. MW5194]|uniref:hypothetical protein n=1 Tax=Legionella sp. MW5194 TaxID=2662448 RepID=UPI001EEFDF13|nr:hypothetical protein [Legionella sp. MW5194]
MMKWNVPAKTFLLGEYAALEGGSALILTTKPCFELTLVDEPVLKGIDSASPAGRYWLSLPPVEQGLHWYDPYGGLGGLGASSAQFLAVYLANCHLRKSRPNHKELLERYFQFAWDGKGIKPSGYDVLAQEQQQCVFINRQRSETCNYPWPFGELGFILVHSSNKLPTHQHLQSFQLQFSTERLSRLADQGCMAFEQANDTLLVNAVNACQQQLEALHLVAAESVKTIAALKSNEGVVAAKGCGALGADVILLLVEKRRLSGLRNELLAQEYNVLATNVDLHLGEHLVESSRVKTRI